MSHHPSRPPGEDPKKESNPPPRPTSSLSEPSTQCNAPIMYPTLDPEEDERERESMRRYRELERQNPYRADWDRDRSRSPMRSSPPIRQRIRYHEAELPPLPRPLPPLSEIWNPFRGIQTWESSIRSTAHASPFGTAPSPTPTYRGAMNDPPRRNALDMLPPFAELASPTDLTPFSTPCPTRQSLNTQHREAFPDDGDTCSCDDAYQEEIPDVEENEREDDQQVKGDSAEGPCEFTSPCNMDPSPDGMHFRKVISHVFGRNKSSTKLIPEWVWVHYCRKHYQRARYRADQWPFTQCELILESLNRMKEWGGVQNFELVLRRRELKRLEEAEASQARTGAASSSDLLPSGRRHPTAIVSPVPVWLRERRGREMSFDDIRNTIVDVRNYMTQLREQEKEREANETGNAQQTGNAKNSDNAKNSGNAKKSSNAKKTDNAQKSGNAKNSGNAKKSGNAEKSDNAKKPDTAKKFDDAQKSDKTSKKEGEIRKNASCVRFPDVEILPRFRQWVIDEALRQRAAEKAAKAAKKKVTKAANKKEKEEHQEEPQTDEGYDETMEDGENNAPAREAAGASTNAGPSNAAPSDNDDDLSLTESARRRSERLFLRMVEGKSVTRVSDRGSVKKPRKKE